MIWQLLIVLAVAVIIGGVGVAAGVWWAGVEDQPDRWHADDPNRELL